MPIRREVVRRLVRAVLAIALAAACGPPLFAQRFAWLDKAFEYRRIIQVPARRQTPAIVVTEFLSHGQLNPASPSLAVYGRERDDLAPYRILQLGPGDFCRIAIQTVDGGDVYHIYYGGGRESPRPQPKWTATQGLLLETRRWKPCNLFRLDSVQEAFEQSERVGSDYVGQVFHRGNPFATEPGPFLSRYQGILHAPVPGDYTFYTSSQDCSFLQIDGKQVAAAPGAHPPPARGRFHGTIRLTEGPHRFEYLHGASSAEACMVAAWRIPNAEQLQILAPTAFRGGSIERLPAVPLEHSADKLSPDFQFSVVGDVPLENDGQPLVRVRFANTSHEGIVKRAKIRWDFGDGQSSQQASPTHVYLQPGGYQVTLSMRLGDSDRQISNQVRVGRAVVFPDKQAKLDELADYMAILKTYDPRRLSPAGLLQLVRAHVESEELAEAVRVGKLAFESQGAAADDETRWRLVSLLGPILRDRLTDAQGAWDLWRAAGSSISRADWRAQCAVEAAEVAIDDLMRHDQAGPLLDFAATRWKDATGETAGRLHRLRGDWHARNGDAGAARAAYAQAETARQLARDAVQRTAWRGACSRSTEFYLRSGELDRARDQLRRWQLDYPADKGEGYLSLLLARYWEARKEPSRAIRVANDLLTVNPTSPYADRLLFLAAGCEESSGRPERAAASYQSLATDYPGSPLAADARERLKQLGGQGGGPETGAGQPKARPQRPSASRRKK